MFWMNNLILFIARSKSGVNCCFSPEFNPPSVGNMSILLRLGLEMLVSVICRCTKPSEVLITCRCYGIKSLTFQTLPKTFSLKHVNINILHIYKSVLPQRHHMKHQNREAQSVFSLHGHHRHVLCYIQSNQAGWTSSIFSSVCVWGFSRRKVEVSQRGCRTIRRGQERLVSACSPPVPVRLPEEAAAGWERWRAAGSGSHQTGRSWRRGSSGEWLVADSCRYALGEETGSGGCQRYVKVQPGIKNYFWHFNVGCAWQQPQNNIGE